jgi:hypothetical protein
VLNRRSRSELATERRESSALTLVRLSHTQWFFVNLYESVVRMPERLADQHDSATRSPQGGPFGWGSPAHYHLPAASVVLGSALTAVATAGRRREGWRAIVLATASSLSATAISGYIIRTVNLRLFDDGPPIAAEERTRLVGRWYALNGVRLTLLAIATLGYEYAAWSRRRPRFPPPTCSFTPPA